MLIVPNPQGSTNTYDNMRIHAYAEVDKVHNGAAMDEMGEVFEAVARYFSILSEPARLRILHSICQGEKSVGQIVEESGMTQTNVSRHLNLMYQGGAVKRRREGAMVFYSVADAALTEVCRTVCIRVSSELDASKALKRNFKEVIGVLS
jgi:DNA-binding transcriptional ArsR family regulator